ncbi:MAG: NAD(P)H-dependent oxidoreductase [Planctomycetota bacterium]
MTRKIAIIDGHPDRDRARFVHALADAYADGASSIHEVRQIDVAGLGWPTLTSRAEWQDQPPLPAVAEVQEIIAWADHLLILYPLWLGDMPATLKGFFEQVMRPSFAFHYRENKLPKKGLKGKSARIVVTMGMPALFYRLVYGAHSVKSLKRNILNFVGISPVDCTLIGNVEGSAKDRLRWLQELQKLGAAAG